MEHECDSDTNVNWYTYDGPQGLEKNDGIRNQRKNLDSTYLSII